MTSSLHYHPPTATSWNSLDCNSHLASGSEATSSRSWFFVICIIIIKLPGTANNHFNFWLGEKQQFEFLQTGGETKGIYQHFFFREWIFKKRTTNLFKSFTSKQTNISFKSSKKVQIYLNRTLSSYLSNVYILCKLVCSALVAIFIPWFPNISQSYSSGWKSRILLQSGNWGDFKKKVFLHYLFIFKFYK